MDKENTHSAVIFFSALSLSLSVAFSFSFSFSLLFRRCHIYILLFGIRIFHFKGIEQLKSSMIGSVECFFKAFVFLCFVLGVYWYVFIVLGHKI